MNRSILCCLVVFLALDGVVVWQLRSGAPPSDSVDSDDRIQPQPGQKEFELDPEIQQEIWESEHATFEIETHLGRRFVQAVASRS
ncbi:MAG TPA: hypothetical protein EYG03_20470, partial [Planctomycetes bacterium]|nr:hypothetical protein [Planctomycetota bacterium]